MKRRSAFLAIVAVLAGRSVAVAPDLGLDHQYPFVGECGGASGTAISRRAVITAKHVPGMQFGVGGEIFTAVERVNHPTYDLAVLLFDRDLPGWHPLGASAPLGTEVEWVGYGGAGSANYQWQGYDIRYGNHGRHRAANTVHRKWEMFGMGPALVSMLEGHPRAAAVNGDSGGGCFANGHLVGVVSYAFNERSGAFPNYGFAVLNGGVPYHGSGAIDLTLPEIRSWVLAQVRKTSFVGPPIRTRPQGRGGRLPATLPLPFFSVP